MGQVSTAEGPDGDWSNWTLCDEGEAVESWDWRVGTPQTPWDPMGPEAKASMAFGLKVTVPGQKHPEAMQAMQGCKGSEMRQEMC